MNSETKLFVGMILATVFIIAGALFVFSRPTNAPAADPKLLMNEDSHRLGTPSAVVTLVEFGDFQCPACSVYHTVVKQIMKSYKDSLTMVFRNYPLPIHSNALPAARAAEAAGKQGKFWEMSDKLYETQNEWSSATNAGVIFTGYAKGLGLDIDQFNKDAVTDEVKKRIDRDIADADVLGINATPTFYINNEKIQNPASAADFEALIKAAINKASNPSESPVSR